MTDKDTAASTPSQLVDIETDTETDHTHILKVSVMEILLWLIF